MIFSGNSPSALTAQIYENGISLYAQPIALTTGQSMPLTDGTYLFSDAPTQKNVELDYLASETAR